MYEFLEETVGRNVTRAARSIAPEMTVGDLLRLFAANSLDSYPVESSGRVVGIVSKIDALKAFAPKPGGILPHYNDAMGTTVEEVMSHRP